MTSWSRRLKQLPMLFSKSDKLRRTDHRVRTGGSTLHITVEGATRDCMCVDVSPGGVKVDPILQDLAPQTPVVIGSPSYFRELPGHVLRHDEDGTVLLFEDPDQALAFVGLLTAAT